MLNRCHSLSPPCFSERATPSRVFSSASRDVARRHSWRRTVTCPTGRSDGRSAWSGPSFIASIPARAIRRLNTSGGSLPTGVPRSASPLTPRRTSAMIHPISSPSETTLQSPSSARSSCSATEWRPAPSSARSGSLSSERTGTASYVYTGTSSMSRSTIRCVRPRTRRGTGR